jgi:hypothetical protein
MKRGATYTRPAFCPPRVHMIDFKNHRRSWLARLMDRLHNTRIHHAE